MLRNVLQHGVRDVASTNGQQCLHGSILDPVVHEIVTQYPCLHQDAMNPQRLIIGPLPIVPLWQTHQLRKLRERIVKSFEVKEKSRWRMLRKLDGIRLCLDPALRRSGAFEEL